MWCAKKRKTHVYIFRRRRKQTWSRHFTQFKSKQKSKRVLERLVMCKIEAKPFNITIIQCYAPTTDHPEKEVEEFYSQIEEALKQTNKQTNSKDIEFEKR